MINIIHCSQGRTQKFWWNWCWNIPIWHASPWFQKQTKWNASILYRITQTSLQSSATDWFSNKLKIFWCDDRGIVWRSIWEVIRTECPRPKVSHKVANVVVLGCIAHNGLGRLHFIDGIMNPEVCMEILKNQMLLPPVTCWVDITFFSSTMTLSTNFLYVT